MKKKYSCLMMMSLAILMFSGCSNSEDTVSSDSSSSKTDNVVYQSAVIDKNAVEFSETVGVWTYRNDIIFHSSDGNRYLLTEDNAGTIMDTSGKHYVMIPCDYQLYTILKYDETTLTVREGRYSEQFLNSKDYPDGYKRMVITYDKSDAFDIVSLENNKPDSNDSETMISSENMEVISETETTTVISEEIVSSETEILTEPQSQETSSLEVDAETENPGTVDINSEDHQSAEYADIYQKIQDFLETDNYKQKDPGNRSLEIFNYLHNLASQNIEQSSIANENNIVSFKCYDKYTIMIDNENAEITVQTD